jgi:hypothetical protein
MIDAKSSEDALAAAGTEKVSLADWESATLIWALAGVVSLADCKASLANSGQAVEAISLAD